ncbi:hypothetical protein OROGR_006566 [Orobanche gracilis]
MNTRSCNCNRWDLTGIPCRHAWTVITFLRDDGENYVTENHTTAAYRRSYDLTVPPISDHIFWPSNLTVDECSPPIIEKKVGRPKVMRISV